MRNFFDKVLEKYGKKGYMVVYTVCYSILLMIVAVCMEKFVFQKEVDVAHAMRFVVLFSVLGFMSGRSTLRSRKNASKKTK